MFFLESCYYLAFEDGVTKRLISFSPITEFQNFPLWLNHHVSNNTRSVGHLLLYPETSSSELLFLGAEVPRIVYISGLESLYPHHLPCGLNKLRMSFPVNTAQSHSPPTSHTLLFFFSLTGLESKHYCSNY